jgi:hypothetical protein
MGNAAWSIPGFSFSLPANADYSVEATYLYTGVRALAATGTGITTETAVAPVSATGDPIVGVMQNNPQLAEAATIVQNGISKLLCKDTVAIGDKLMACPAGGFIKATTGKYAVAIALQAGAANQYVAGLLANLGLQ